MLFTASTYSQTVINTKESRVGTWDAIKESWSYSLWKKANITFTANSDGVVSDDQAKSVYTFTTSRQTKKGFTRMVISIHPLIGNVLMKKAEHANL